MAQVIYRIYNANFDLAIEADSSAEALAKFAETYPELADQSVVVLPLDPNENLSL